MDIDNMAQYINGWANQQFPQRTDASMFLKLYGEIAEMIESDGDGSEIADVLIMVLDYAVRKGVNITEAVSDKMAVNLQRVWKQNSLGAYSHVKPEALPLRIQSLPGDGSGDAIAGSEAVAHSGDQQDPDPCRTLGKCGAPGLVNCPHFAGGIFSERKPRDYCPMSRFGRGVAGGYSYPLEKTPESRRNTRLGAASSAPGLFPDSEGGLAD